MVKPKTPLQMERHMKGVANYRRIEILFAISDNEGITLDGICQVVRGNNKTISEHTKKLSQSGLIRKIRRGRGVSHSLSPYGKNVYKFLRAFSIQA
ncbi:MAG: winged helix-turn-helix transcriptional regulator [Candidatus Moranbacteria bacterium]|nr:winged helix-turn-helix transcriptional regulator [Candidatus Moranbacteria bacterium]